MYDNVWEKFMYSSQFSARALSSTCVCEVVVCSDQPSIAIQQVN